MDPSFLYFKDSANTIQQDKNYYDSNFLDLLKTTALAVAKLNSTLAAKQKEIQKYNANLDSDSPTLPQHLDQNGLSKNLQFLDESERKVYIKNRLKNYVDTKLKITLAETQTKIDTVYNQFTIDFTSLKETLKDYLPTSAMPTPEHAKLLLDNKALNIFVQFNLTAKKHELIAENKRRLAEAAKKKKDDAELDTAANTAPPTDDDADAEQVDDADAKVSDDQLKKAIAAISPLKRNSVAKIMAQLLKATAPSAKKSIAAQVKLLTEALTNILSVNQRRAFDAGATPKLIENAQQLLVQAGAPQVVAKK